MNDYLYPTHDQAVLALLNAILTHYEVKNSLIYYPVILGEVPQIEPIRIASARDFGGMELIESGLTLAVYPLHGGFDQKSAAFSARERKSVKYDDKYLGRAGDTNYGVHSTFSFVVQLFYRDASLNAPVAITSDVLTDESGDNFYPLTISPAQRVQYKDSRLPADVITLEELLDNEQAVIEESTIGNNVSLTVFTLPAERILRSWMSLLVKVIRSLTVLRPFCIKNPTVEYVDYPTSNWLRDSSNLVFHTSYLIVSYDCIEPAGSGEFTFPVPTPTPTPTPIRDFIVDHINLETETTPGTLKSKTQVQLF